MSCPINPVDCIADAASSVASSAWDMVCNSFAKAASQMLTAFAKAFAAMPNVDLSSDGVRNVYAISMGVASFIAVLLLLIQVARTAITHDGSAMAQGLIGVGKAAMAFMLTLVFANAGLLASDDLTKYIITKSFGSTDALSAQLGNLVKYDGAQGAAISTSLILLLAILGILLTIVLWFELLLRNAAIAILIATSPIAAAGQVSESTKPWWSKMVATTIQLIVLKPVIALTFALGFGLTGGAKDIEGLLIGMLVLLLAAFAWPVVAKFYTFTAVQMGAAGGLGALLGFAAGRADSASGGKGSPSGVSPEKFGQQSEARTMAAVSGRSGATPALAGAGAGMGGGAGAAAGVGAKAAMGPMGIAAAGLSMAQKGVNSLGGRMEQMAGHGGVHPGGAYSPAAGYPARESQSGKRGTGGGGRPGAEQPTPAVPQQPVSPSTPSNVRERHADPMPESPRPAEPEAPYSQTPNAPQPPMPTTPPVDLSTSMRNDPPTVEFPAVRDEMPPPQHMPGTDTPPGDRP
jgi:hypothetical protein